mmetsp:Transcript_28550/g.25267  ORF Transcript_28550/g.25267 Transcript_28550/m.25267 type:complete len:110 (+) Transcript_28550:21-350(+)
MKFEPRKFSFDPITKKIFSSEPESEDGETSTKFYHEGKLVENEEDLSISKGKDFWKEVGKTMNSEEESPLSYLKSVIDSDSTADDLAFDFEEFNLDHIKTDEELASESL